MYVAEQTSMRSAATLCTLLLDRFDASVGGHIRSREAIYYWRKQ